MRLMVLFTIEQLETNYKLINLDHALQLWLKNKKLTVDYCLEKEDDK